MTTPKNVERQDVMAALEPLFALIGADPSDVAGDPPLTIDADYIYITTLSPEADVRIPIVSTRPEPVDLGSSLAIIAAKNEAMVSVMTQLASRIDVLEKRVSRGSSIGTKLGWRR